MANLEKNCNLCEMKFKYDDNGNDADSVMVKICTVCKDKDICYYCSFMDRYIYNRNKCSYCKTIFTHDQDIRIIKNSVNFTPEQFSKVLIAYWTNPRCDTSYIKFQAIFAVYMEIKIPPEMRYRFTSTMQYGGFRLIEYKNKYYILTSDHMLNRADIINPLFHIFNISGVLITYMDDNIKGQTSFELNDEGDIVLHSECQSDELRELTKRMNHCYFVVANKIKYWKLLRERDFMMNSDTEKDKDYFNHSNLTLYYNAEKIECTLDNHDDDSDSDSDEEEDNNDEYETDTEDNDYMINPNGNRYLREQLIISDSYNIPVWRIKYLIEHCEDFDINSIERQFSTFETRRERICDLHTQTILRNSQELESDSDSD